MAPIPDPCLAVRVVAPRHGVHPRQRVSGHLTDLFAPLPPCQQPDDLPLAARHRVLCLPVAALQLLHTQIRSYTDAFSHVQVYHRKWYHSSNSYRRLPGMHTSYLTLDEGDAQTHSFGTAQIAESERMMCERSEASIRRSLRRVLIRLLSHRSPRRLIRWLRGIAS